MRGLLTFPAIVAAVLAAGCTRPATPPATGDLVTAEVPPDLIEKMRTDLAQQAGISASDAKVVRAQSIVWPNGALGCEQPGQMYTQATVPGYVVELAHGGRTYSYHASKDGGFQRCENPTSRQGADVK
jgi:hypothetical protein